MTFSLSNFPSKGGATWHPNPFSLNTTLNLHFTRTHCVNIKIPQSVVTLAESYSTIRFTLDFCQPSVICIFHKHTAVCNYGIKNSNVNLWMLGIQRSAFELLTPLRSDITLWCTCTTILTTLYRSLWLLYSISGDCRCTIQLCKQNFDRSFIAKCSSLSVKRALQSDKDAAHFNK